MKAWKINVKSNHSLWSFVSPEALYIWKIDGANFKGINEYEDVTSMTLRKGDTLFVEWKGTEYVYDDKYDETFKLKMLKLIRVRTNESGSKQFKHTIEGWISDDIISLSDPELRIELSQPYSIKRLDKNGGQFHNIFEAA